MNYEALIGMNITQFLIGFVRASGLIITAPVFQSKSVPPQIKILLAAALALTAGSYIKSDLDLQSLNFWMAVVVLIQEVLIGLIMGMMANLIMYGIQVAGYFFDVPMGFSMINVIDPQSGIEIPMMAQFNYIVAALVYLAINGHHTLIISFIKSFDVVKPGMLFLKKETAGIFLQAFSNIFYLGFKIGIPVMGTIFLTDVAMGIISKLIPQINVFVMGFPIKIMIGILVLILFIPTYVFLIEQSFSASGSTFKFLRLILSQMTQNSG